MQISVEWQSNIQFYTKSVSQKLAEIGRDFGFKIEPSISYDHEELAALRWRLQDRLGKNNHCATRALTKLYFTYMNYGQAFLRDEDFISQLFDDLVCKFGSAAVTATTMNFRPSRGTLVLMDAKTVNSLMSEYHFLGYGRSDGYHLGMYFEDGGKNMSAAATFSPWDLDHATPVLQRLGIRSTEVLVLSRLLSIPGTRRLTLSQFISQLNHWVRREMPEIKMVVTYCNPNAGHYGTVYRGANFLPLCTENHPFIPFLSNEYISPRKFEEFYNAHGAVHCRSILHAGTVKPLPLLIYYYPIRLSCEVKRQMTVGHCAHPYPIDLTACSTEE